MRGREARPDLSPFEQSDTLQKVMQARTLRAENLNCDCNMLTRSLNLAATYARGREKSDWLVAVIHHIQ